MRCTAQLEDNCIAIHCQVKNAIEVDFFFEVDGGPVQKLP